MLRHPHTRRSRGVGSAPLRSGVAVCPPGIPVRRWRGGSGSAWWQPIAGSMPGKPTARQGFKAAGQLGRKPALNAEQRGELDVALRRGPIAHGFGTDLRTLPRIAAALERLTGVRHHPAHVWRILQGLKWSLQRSAKRARARRSGDSAVGSAALAPGKNTPDAVGRGSSSKTRAGSRSSPSCDARARRAGTRPP